MNIIVFDTETIGVEKAFCYDLGYVVVNVESKTIIAKKSLLSSKFGLTKHYLKPPTMRTKNRSI